MTSKERMMLALNLEKPDRLPVTTMDLMPYWRKTEMNNLGVVECYKALELDASYFAPNPCYWPYDAALSSEDWKVSASSSEKDGEISLSYSFKTPKGTLTMKQAQNDITTWVTEHLVKNKEDIDLLKYRPNASFDKKLFEKMYDELGDAGILRTGGFGFQEGCWQDACEMYGVENMIMATYDNPEWVHEFLGILLDQKLEFIGNNFAGLKVDLVLTGGGASSNTVISPKIHEEFCLPYDLKMNKAIQKFGHKVVYHTCGGMTKILDLIMKNGCDASESLSKNTAGGDVEDPSVVKNKFSDKVCMIGGFDQVQLLPNGTEEEITKEVKRLFNGLGLDGGYIMMTSDHFFDCPREKLEFYAKAARLCAY